MRTANPALFKPWLSSTAFATDANCTTPEKGELHTQQSKIERVELFEKQFLWNSTLYEKIDQQILMSKNDNEPPKGFEKFFKNREKRTKESKDNKQDEKEGEGKEETKKEDESDAGKRKYHFRS